LPLLHEQDVTTLKMLKEDRFALANMPLILLEFCDFTLFNHMYLDTIVTEEKGKSG
jgi:hypothetical protein